MRTDPDATAPESAPQTVIRYANRAGALVAVTRAPRAPAGWDHAAACDGCLDAITPHRLDSARDWANTHAGQCRALPQPDPRDADGFAARLGPPAPRRDAP